MKSFITLNVLAMISGTNANFLDKIRARFNPPGTQVSVTSVPAPPDFPPDAIPMQTTALNEALTTDLLSTTDGFQVQLQTIAAEISPADQEPSSPEPQTVESTSNEQNNASKEPEAPTPKEAIKAAVPAVQDASALNNQNVDIDASENTPSDNPTSDNPTSDNTTSDNPTSDNTTSDNTTSNLADQSGTSPLGEQNAQNSQNSSSEEESNAPDKSTTIGIVMGVLACVVGIAVFVIFFGIPTFKKWSSKDDSNLTNPNWEAIREERKQADLERYYDSFS